MKKKNFIRLISFLVAAIFVGFGYTMSFYSKSKYLKEQIENGYMNSLTEFSENISQIDFDLKKQLCSNSNLMKMTLANDICKNASSAKECLSRIPISQENAENIYKYLATVSDFSRVNSISKASSDNTDNLKALIDFSEQLNTDFDILISKTSNKNVFDEEIKNMLNNVNVKTTFSSNFEDISQISKSFPTLIYDGPFSDHINRLTPKLIENEQTIELQQLRKKAEELLNKTVTFSGEENSNIKSFIFENENGVCAITEKGGYCLYLNKNAESKKKNISVQKAVNTARDYLKKLYDNDFKESYYDTTDNVITINFASFSNGVICYSDLIKVGVSLQDGEILSVEARGFIMNNHNRKIPDFNINDKKIKQKISDELTVKSVSKSLILDNALNEKYCYEVKCTTDDKQDVIVYLNKDSLEEENILFIIHSDNGVLTK